MEELKYLMNLTNNKITDMVNQKLAEFFKANGIKRVNLLSVGNSIASGYSMTRTTKPLLLRNESIESIMRQNGVELERHNFSRSQNNNEEHVFEWLVNNTKESELNRMNRSDYSGSATSMQTNKLTEDMIMMYYPINIPNDRGMQDFIRESNRNNPSIIVYNGCTGSFLDNVTREGKIRQMLTYGIKRDITGLNAILKYIQTSNRMNNTNTQVYICGVPNLLGIGITEIINKKIKKLVKDYANVTYVKPIKSKFFYKNIETLKTSVDVHYDEQEYLELNRRILETIKDNYMIKEAMINVDRMSYKYSTSLEMAGKKEEQDVKTSVVMGFINKQNISEEDKLRFLKELKKYLLEREPYDYFYIGKNSIKGAIENKDILSSDLNSNRDLEKMLTKVYEERVRIK